VGAVSQPGSNQNPDLATPYSNLGFNGSPRIATFVDLTVSHPGPGRDLQNKAATVLRNCEGCMFEGMSAVAEAVSLGPDLVGFWGGNNDALDAMLAGFALEGVTLTPVDQFSTSYNEVMAGLAAPGRTVVAFNIPNINDIPFATTIPPVVVNPATLQPVIVNGAPVPLLGPGDDAYPCDPAPPCGLPPGTLVTLSASPLLAAGIGIPTSIPGGTGQPLPHGSFEPPATVNVGVLLYPDDHGLARVQLDLHELHVVAEDLVIDFVHGRHRRLSFAEPRAGGARPIGVEPDYAAPPGRVAGAP
jgi:hypothetical protein